MKSTPISVVIPTLNEQDYLPVLLQSFVDQDFDGEYEIIVVDGGSVDSTLEVVSQYQELLPNLFVYGCNRGISKQRNYGAKKAHYNHLVFLDADMKVPKHALSKIKKHFQRKTNFIAVPILFPYDGKFLLDLLLALVGYGFFMAVRGKHPILSGMCIITTKEIHERIGGFDEQAIVGEDIDYGLRAYDHGAKYYILFSVLITGSARRFDKIGRFRTLRTWKKWYDQILKTGPITKSQGDYVFGKFKKD